MSGVNDANDYLMRKLDKHRAKEKQKEAEEKKKEQAQKAAQNSN